MPAKENYQSMIVASAVEWQHIRITIILTRPLTVKCAMVFALHLCQFILASVVSNLSTVNSATKL